MNIDIKVVKKADSKQLLSIYKEIGWWTTVNPEKDLETIDKIVSNSFLFVCAYLDRDIIGMGRAISDGISDAYIQDVAVLDKYRKQGIGKQIISELIKNLKKAEIDWIGLVSEPDATEFYKRINFKEMKGYRLMLLKE